MVRRLYLRLRPLLPTIALFSGVALLLNIIGGIDLRLALAGSTIGMLFGLGTWLTMSSPAERRWIVRNIGVGAAAGIVATVAYDISKAALSQLDPSPYDPFHAVQVFGELLAGAGSPGLVIFLAGAGFHLLNGTMFGVAYTMLFARDGAVSVRRALGTGIIWGLFLETFQLTLYPGWLSIALYQEFVTISALGHVVYGATLGLVARMLFRGIGGPAESAEVDSRS